MRKLKGYQKFNEELSPETLANAAYKMRHSDKPNKGERADALRDWRVVKEKSIQSQLNELDEFVRVQLQDIDPNEDRFQYETYCPQVDGRRSLAGSVSKWNIALILDTSEDYQGIDLNELWPIMEGIEEYLKYQCDNIELECLIGSVRGETGQTEITEDMKDTVDFNNWSWIGAKFNLK
jgi:hypothetical protein